jgi:hypothetical protein
MFAKSPPKKMNIVIFIIFVLIFLSILIVLLSTLFGSEPFSCSNLLEELARKHQGKLCSLGFGHSAVELPLSFGSMLVGVWARPMLGTSRTTPRATISVQSTSLKDIPEFRINSKYALSCGGVYGFRKASCTDSSVGSKFKQKWCVFVRSEISSQRVNNLLRQLNSPLINLNRQALSPQWDIVNISCQGQRMDFVYSKPIYDIDSLEILMQASVEFVQALI